MSTMAGGFATSHTALMIRAQKEADPQQVAHVMQGFAEVRRRLDKAGVETLVVIGSDHGKTFLLDNMPSFCIGVGAECEGWADAGVPAYRVKVNQELAKYLLAQAMDAGFDPAFSAEMKLDHGFLGPLHFLTPEMDIPIVPIFQNASAAPMASLARCYEFGKMLRKAIDKRPGNERIAFLATGGLSHTVPVLDEYMFREKRQRDPDMEPKRLAKIKEFVDKGSGRINESFDRQILDLVARGEYEGLAAYSSERIEAEGGNGAQEIRNWATLAGALSDRKAEVLLYEPVTKWLTGIAMVAFQ
jgi:aromatic ring-opening dioxygenase catalytic subunit (LigB family)